MSFQRILFTLAILCGVPISESRQNLRDLINRNAFDIKQVLEEVHELRYDIKVLDEKCSIEEGLVNITKESLNDAIIESESESNINNNNNSELLKKFHPLMKPQQVLKGFTDLKLAVHESLEQIRDDNSAVNNRTQQFENNVKTLESQLKSQIDQLKSDLLQVSDGIFDEMREIRQEQGNLISSINSLQTKIQSIEQKNERLASDTTSFREEIKDLQEKQSEEYQLELNDLKTNITLVYSLVTNAFIYFSGSAYSFSQTKSDYHDAATVCRNQNGYLAVITSKAENNFIAENMKSKSMSTSWIGGNDIQSEGQWQWASKERFFYANWDYKEPNNAWGKEDCLQIVQATRKWNDNDCNVPLSFICEMKV